MTRHYLIPGALTPTPTHAQHPPPGRLRSSPFSVNYVPRNSVALLKCLIPPTDPRVPVDPTALELHDRPWESTARYHYHLVV
jgi:hypothetical protein